MVEPGRHATALRATTVAALLIALSACDPVARSSEPAPEAPPPPTSAADVWRLADQPEFSLSEVTGDPPFPVFQAFDGAIAEDGTLIVGNRGDQRLVYLDPSGDALRVVGGEGEGPGEFGSMGDIFAAADGVWVWDARLRRVSRFSAAGDFQEAIPLAVAGPEVPRGVLPDGRVVTTAFRAVPGAVGAPRPYRLRGADGAVVAELQGPVEPPPAEIAFEAEVQPGRQGSMRISVPAGCLSEPTEVVIGPDIFVVDGGAGVVSVLGADGALREIHRAAERPPITEQVREDLRDWIMSTRIPPPADSLEKMFERMGEVGDQLPAWQGVLADLSGRLWLERSRCRGQEAPTYHVIDTSGRLLATVEAPAELRVLAVRGERLLAVRTDALRVESVELYRVLGVSEPDRSSGGASDQAPGTDTPTGSGPGSSPGG